MAVSELTNSVTANGNGVARTFSFSPVKISKASDLVVLIRDAAGLETPISEGSSATTYSISVSSYPGIGSIDYPASGGILLATGESVTMRSVRALTQAVNLENQGGYFADTQETAFDKLTYIAQQQQVDINKSIKFPPTDAVGALVTLPTSIVRAGKALIFDINGDITAGAIPSTAVATVDETDTGTVKDKLINNLMAKNWTLTTKGDLRGFDIADTRLGVGTNGQQLTPDSAEALGIKWSNQLAVDNKAATYTVVASDQNKVIGLSGASFTINLTSAATLGAGFAVGFHHNGTTDTNRYTINPAGSETIDLSLLLLMEFASETVWIVSDGTNWHITCRSRPTQVERVLDGYINGLQLSNGTDATNDIDIAVGTCTASNANESIRSTSILVKQIDANWAAGSAAGGFPSGLTLTNDTWYHMFLIKNITTGVVDAGFDTSLTAANLLSDATGYTAYRRIGSIRRGTALNVLFSQTGDYFDWDVESLDLDGAGSTVGAALVLLTPPDVVCRADCLFGLNLNGTSLDRQGLLTSLAQANSAPSTNLHTLYQIIGTGTVRYSQNSVSILTDTNSSIRQRVNSNSNTSWRVHTRGYMDFRGKN